MTQPSDPIAPQPLAYRPEIDGLRAIAVLSVILYHAQFVVFGRQVLDGGYVGVDIFFVISGYLITRIIVTEHASPAGFSFKTFYERRARRLLPALFLVIFATLPFAWFRLHPVDFVAYGESLLATLFFGSNAYFYVSGTQYGADTALLSPFIHTWSLAVEEQFYILFPIFTVIALRLFKPHLMTVLFGLSLISLQLADVLSLKAPDLGFYLPLTRFWELGAGALLAMGERPLRSVTHALARNLLPMLGLYLIVYAIVFFDAQTRHPSFMTLIPVLGVVLVLGFASRDELVGRILAWKPLVWIGLISYSAYLWHMPIFAFSRLGASDISNWDRLAWIVATGVLAAASFALVERPFRNRAWLSTKAVLTSLGATFAALSVTMAVIVANDGFTQRLPAILNKDILGKKMWLTFEQDGTPCFERLENFCTQRADGDALDVIVYGDSHLAALSSELLKALNGDYTYLEAHFGGCPFVLGVTRMFENGEIDNKDCTKPFQTARLNALPADPSIIILGGRFPTYLSGYFFDNGEGGVEAKGNHYRTFVGSDGTPFEDKVAQTFERLIAEGHHIVLIYPIPPVGWHVPRRLFALTHGKSVGQIDTLFETAPVTTSSRVFYDHARATFQMFDAIRSPNIHRVYPHRLFCDSDIEGRCVTHNSEDVFYTDDDHPSTKGAQMISALIADAVRDAAADIARSD